MTTQGRPRKPAGNTKLPNSNQSAGLDQLQARIKELEQQLIDRSGGAQQRREPSQLKEVWASAEPRRGAAQLQPVVIAVLGGMVVITAPLAFLTLKRWWHWWVD